MQPKYTDNSCYVIQIITITCKVTNLNSILKMWSVGSLTINYNIEYKSLLQSIIFISSEG
jgi:hypothetical protein